MYSVYLFYIIITNYEKYQALSKCCFTLFVVDYNDNEFNFVIILKYSFLYNLFNTTTIENSLFSSLSVLKKIADNTIILKNDDDCFYYFFFFIFHNGYVNHIFLYQIFSRFISSLKFSIKMN